MKQKLLTLFTLLLCVCSGAWGATTTLPTSGSYSNGTTKYSLTNSSSIVKNNTIYFAARSTISLSSDYGMRPYTTGFYLEVTAAANVTFNVKSATTSARTITGQVYVAKDELSYVWNNTTLSPVQTLENYVIAVNAKSSDLTDEESAIKANNTLKNITSQKDGNKKVLIGETYDSNIHTKSGDAINHNCPNTSGGTNSFNVSLPSAGKYLIYLTSTGGSVGITSIDIEATDNRTSVSLSFPNDTEDATLGESFSAPTLTASPAAAAEAVAYSSSNTSVAEVNASTGAITLKAAGSTEITAAISGNATYKDASASYTLNVTDPNAPSLIVSPASLTLTANANNPSPSAVFNVAGANLTDGNYNITVPSIAGLSVSPTSVTVADGSVNQEVTVTYAPSVDAAASSDDITLTIDAIDATLTVNYVATLSVYTQETIDAVTTWDFVNDIDHDNSSDVQGKQTTAKLYANTSIEFKSSFPKASLTYTTSDNYYAYRKANKCSQGAVLSFNTSVPGIVTVLFANNGSSGSQHVKVNDMTGEKESTDGGGSGTTAIEESFPVDAGTVTITGSAPTKIRIFRIKFQPTVSATIPTSGWGTYCSSYALDFSDPSTEVEAYAVSAYNVENLTITYAKQNGVVPAGTGILLKGTAGAANIVVSDEAGSAPADNKLVGFVAPTEYTKTGDTRYLGLSGGNWKEMNAGTIPANKAVLEITSAELNTLQDKLKLAGDDAKFTIILDDEPSGETTSISEELRMKSEESSSAYNLAGQKVGKEYKGIVIVNGKKVIRK